MGNISSYDPKREFTVSSFLIVLISNCPSGGFGGPGGGFGGPGGGFRTGRSSGKPLLLPVLKIHPQEHQKHHQDHQNHHQDN